MRVIPLFSVAIFLSATLLFMVQPLAGKALLPSFGGSPAVWSACLLFFQGALLLGYLYAHALSTRVAPPWQSVIHVVVLIGAGATLPLPIDAGDPAGGDARWRVLQSLTATVGLPFFALSATAPLLQRWFSRTTHPGAGDPYFLYAASNAGSLLGLLAYLAMEPIATRRVQVTAWAVSFWIVAALVAACGVASARHSATHSTTWLPPWRNTWLPPSGGRKPRTLAKGRRESATTTPLSERALWIALALVPSALLLGVTQHLATDVVSVPLLWVAPLALYLITFIAAFSTRTPGRARWWGLLASPAVLLVLVMSLAEVRYPILPVTLVHLASFAVLAMLCHTYLAERRPAAAHLTGYFVCVSLGGVLGGAAAALLAPAVFSSILEYPLAIGAAVLLRPQTITTNRMAASRVEQIAWAAGAATLLVASYWCVSAFDERANTQQLVSSPLVTWLRPLAGDEETAQRVLRASFVIPAVVLWLWPRTAVLFAATTAGLLVGAGAVRTGGEVLARERTFFGVHQVTSVQNGDWHVLTHGTTTHGLQALRGKLRSLPTAYYHPAGPLGDVVFTLASDKRFRDIGVVGLGAGAIAAYAGGGVRMDFFEIDQAVIRIAENAEYFTYLADARARAAATVRTIAADGRLGLRGTPAASYDLIVIDAFSSDAIPTHLITREAVAIYESRLKARGLIAFHVSSRFFDLPPVLARIAGDKGLVGYTRHDAVLPPEKAAEGMRASVWVVLARDASDLGQLARSGPRWVALASKPGDPLWTDDYTNVLGVLR